MAGHIYKCEKCKVYTMASTCNNCSQKTILPRPPKYSPEDKYSEYRRKIKKAILINEGQL